MKATLVTTVLYLTSLGQLYSQNPFPLKISSNKRYFITQQGTPFLYHADTGWQMFVKLTAEEAIL